MTAATFLIALAIGVLASAVGGILGGITLAGKDLGAQLAGTMGGAFGPVAGVGGVTIALAILAAMAAG